MGSAGRTGGCGAVGGQRGMWGCNVSASGAQVKAAELCEQLCLSLAAALLDPTEGLSATGKGSLCGDCFY